MTQAQLNIILQSHTGSVFRSFEAISKWADKQKTQSERRRQIISSLINIERNDLAAVIENACLNNYRELQNSDF